MNKYHKDRESSKIRFSLFLSQVKVAWHTFGQKVSVQNCANHYK